jgi:hypothetical protein
MQRLKLDAGADGHHIVHREGGTLEERGRAKRQLHDFVNTTLERLIAIETRRNHAKVSSLMHLARLDISVMPTSTGELSYFVNEVERGVGVCLYTKIDHSRSMDVIDEFREVLLRWLDTLPCSPVV